MRSSLRVVGATTRTMWPLLQRAPRAACAPLALLRSPSAAATALYTRSLCTRATPEHKLNGLLTGASRARELLVLHRVHGKSFNDINLATCWSRLGRVNYADRFWLQSSDCVRRLSALRKQTSFQLRTLRPRELSNVTHALAKLDLRGPAWEGFWKELEGVVLARNRSDFAPQGLSNTAWAFTTAGHATEALMDAVAEECAGRVREFKPQELSNTAWAFATAGHPAPALLDAIGKESAGRVREFTLQALANMACAFATAGRPAPELFDAIGTECERREREFKPLNLLSKTAWAFATAGHAAPALFDAIGAESAGKVCEMTPRELASIAWAFAVSDHLPSESSLFDQRFARRCDALADKFSVEALCQLHQWRLWYANERACSEGLPGAALLARCEAAFRAGKPAPSNAAEVASL